MPFVSQNTEAITFPADDTTLAFFGAGEFECFHCMDCLLVSGSKWWTQHSSWVRKCSTKRSGSASNLAKFSSDMTSLVSFWSGVKSRGTHRAETFDMPSSLWRMFSTRSREMLITLAKWLMVNRLSFITIWWMRSMFSWVVAVEGRPDLGSSSRLSLPLLNSLPTSSQLIKLEHHPPKWKPYQHEFPWVLILFSANIWSHHSAKSYPYSQDRQKTKMQNFLDITKSL